MPDQMLASTRRSEPAGPRWWVRTMAIGLASGVLAGVIAALPARLLMRIVALSAGQQTHFSWGATLGIALIFGIAMIPGALLSAATRRHRRWLLFLGALLLFIPATGVASDELGATSGFTIWNWAGVFVSGAGVYCCIVVMPFLAARLIRRWSR
jgi:hypothetical protein